jgi:hypothetical protein
MSTSTDAILGYGYVWDEVAPDNTYDLIEGLNEKYPLCKVGVHSHIDNPMLYITAKRLEVTAYRGSPKTLMEDLQPKSEELEQLAGLYIDVCKMYGEEVPEEVTFNCFICSYWG